jgi:hypothetical protein
LLLPPPFPWPDWLTEIVVGVSAPTTEYTPFPLRAAATWPAAAPPVIVAISWVESDPGSAALITPTRAPATFGPWADDWAVMFAARLVASCVSVPTLAEGLFCVIDVIAADAIDAADEGEAAVTAEATETAFWAKVCEEAWGLAVETA